MATFDSYSRHARLVPALLVFVPALVMVLAWNPTLLEPTWSKAGVAVLSTCGVLYLLSVFSRSQGKALERRLLVEWGGWPTTLWLRHRSAYLNVRTKARYHRVLSQLVPELRFPTQEEETADPGAADLIYSSAVEALKEQARGDELVEKEVTEYGFRRNLLGLKPYGILLCALGAALGIAQMGLYEFSHPSFTWLNDNAFKFSAVALSLGAVAAWTWFITKPWVFEAANQYARALLATCDRPRSAEGHAEAHTA